MHRKVPDKAAPRANTSRRTPNNSMNLNLKDKVVMITGSTGGVGEALVRAFAAEGCKLAISSTRQSKLDAMLPNIDIAPDHLLTFVVDVTKEDQIKDITGSLVTMDGGQAPWEGNHQDKE